MSKDLRKAVIAARTCFYSWVLLVAASHLQASHDQLTLFLLWKPAPSYQKCFDLVEIETSHKPQFNESS